MSQKFTDFEIKVMKNFGVYNPSILIEPTGIKVQSTTKSVIAHYPFEASYSFDSFGVYDINNLLSIFSALNSEFEVTDKLLKITNGKETVNYSTQAPILIGNIPDVENLLKPFEIKMELCMPADKLAIISKMAGILKSKFIFFETEGKNIKITVGDDLDSSINNMEQIIEDNIYCNSLTEPVKININDFNIFQGEYKIKIFHNGKTGEKSKYMFKWENLNNVVYYIPSGK